MRRLPGINVWSRTTFALIVVAANIFAPFRTSLARTPLETAPHQGATRAIVRVRTISRALASPTFDSIVGLARGGGDDETAMMPPVVSWVLPPTADFRPTKDADRQVAHLTPHRRC
jgi:hypothetical protein